MVRVPDEKTLIAFDTSALIGATSDRLKDLKVKNVIFCIPWGVVLEIGNREPAIRKKGFNKLIEHDFHLLREAFDLVQQESQLTLGKTITIFPLELKQTQERFIVDIQKLAGNEQIKDFEDKRKNQLERSKRWWNDLANRKHHYDIDPMTLGDIDALAQAKLKKMLSEINCIADPGFVEALESVRSKEYDDCPPSLKAWFRFDSFSCLLKKIQHGQKKMRANLAHKEGVEQIMVDSNTLDDMRHFLMAYKYIDAIITCDFGMMRLIQLFYPDDQKRVLFLKRDSGHNL